MRKNGRINVDSNIQINITHYIYNFEDFISHEKKDLEPKLKSKFRLKYLLSHQ